MATSITPLRCGTLTAGTNMFEADGTDQRLTIPVPSWLLQHGDDLVLVDTGMHADLRSPGEYLDTVSMFFDVGLNDQQTVAAALASAGVDVADIDVVILSHLHFDHAGGLAQIPNARVVVQRAEWEAGEDDEMAVANSFVQSDYLLGHDVIAVDGEHDLFGDGAIRCVPTPGHTPGHQSVAVRLANEEIVLCGDCAYFARTLDGGSLPGFGHDLAQQAASVARLVDMRAAGARLLPGHDPDVFAGLPNRLT